MQSSARAARACLDGRSKEEVDRAVNDPTQSEAEDFWVVSSSVSRAWDNVEIDADRLERMKTLVETPAFVYDERTLDEKLRRVAAVRVAAGAKVLYALKPFAIVDALTRMAPGLDGFAASSLFEARLSREVLGIDGTVHITTPGFRPSEIEEIDRLCDYMTFNSLTQWERFRDALSSGGKAGLRINPLLPFVEDERYNPCRPHSKLGAPIDQVARAFERRPDELEGLGGLHFHTNCDSASFAPLWKTVEKLDNQLGRLLERVSWVNLGGGYLFEEAEELITLCRAVDRLKSQYGVEVFLEPGAALVRDAGYLVASVIDLFQSGGRKIAMLDTSVNHMPEVFEYQFEPEVLDHDDEADHEYILAGCTCLAGDIFGLYGFDEPLEIGSRVVFTEAGAYTTVKSHMFNGVNLPAIYAMTESGDLVLKRQYTYKDYLARCGV
jgi:carboxynorspermidine decarboxylase